MDRAERRAKKRGQRNTGPTKRDDSRLRPLGVAVLCLKLFLVPLVFDPSADVPFVVPKALLSHALTYVLVAILVGLFVQRGRAFLVRSWVHVPVVAFLVVSGLAAAFAVNPTLALFGTHVRMLGLATIADGVVTYFAVMHLVRKPREVIALIASIFAASAVVVAYELAQWTGRDPLSWSFDGSLRPFSTLGQPTSLGEYLSILSVVAFALASLTRAMRPWVRSVLIAYSLVLLIAAGVTGTRSAAIGVAAAAGAFVVVVWAKHPSRRARLASVLGAAGAGVVLALVLLVTPIGARLLSTFETAAAGEPAAIGLEESASVRVALYQIALEMVRDRPIFGYGPDNFAVGVPIHRPAPAPNEVRQVIATSAHSWIAYVATSTGLLGLAAFIAVLAASAVALARSPFNPLAAAAALGVSAYLGTGLTSINSLEIDTLYWVGVAGVALASAGRGLGAELETPHRGRGRSASRIGSKRLISWGFVGVAAVFALTTLSALEASRLAKDSVSLRAPNPAQAVDLAARAVQLDGSRAEYWQQLALSYVAAGRWPDASNAFKTAARLAPYDIRFLNDDIQVQLFLANRGDTPALTQAAQLSGRAVAIDPHNPLAHQNKAVVALARRDVENAVGSIEAALALTPDPSDSLLAIASQVYVNAAQTYLAAGRLSDALVLGKHGVLTLGGRPVSVPLRVEYARALAANGQSNDALAEVKAALSLSPNDQAALKLRDQLEGK